MEDRNNLCLIAEMYGNLISNGFELKDDYKDYDINGRVEYIYKPVLEGWYLGVNCDSKEEEEDLSLYSKRVLKDYLE